MKLANQVPPASDEIPPNPDEPELRNYALRDLGIKNKLVVLTLNIDERVDRN
jgi:hypothetical protein